MSSVPRRARQCLRSRMPAHAAPLRGTRGGASHGSAPWPHAGPQHNVPFSTLLNADGTMKPAEDVRAQFEAAGIDPDKQVITTCGSGVTACTLSLGLAVIGNEYAPVYDGSWAEWAAAPSAPAVTD